jgi:hypothetical protein
MHRRMLHFLSELERAYYNVTKTEEKARQRFCIDEDSKLRKRRRREPLTLD